MKELPFILSIVGAATTLDKETQQEMLEVMKTARLTWETDNG